MYVYICVWRLNVDQEGMSSKSSKPKNSHDSWCTHLPIKKKKKALAPVWVQSVLSSGAYNVHGILLGVMGNKRFWQGPFPQGVYYLEREDNWVLLAIK